MCDEWLESFEAFVEDVGERPPYHILGRFNIDGNYEPGNVRWASRSRQNTFTGKLTPTMLQEVLGAAAHAAGLR